MDRLKVHRIRSGECVAFEGAVTLHEYARRTVADAQLLGRRGSEVIRVTEDEATALNRVPRTRTTGPFMATFRFGAASNPDGSFVIAWRDERADAPGIYARRVRLRAR